MNQIIFVPLLLLGAVLLFSTVLAFWLQHTARPSGKVKSFKTRYTPSVWTPEQMDYSLQVFKRIWLDYFPSKSWKVNRTLNNLNIEWSPHRWERSGMTAAAEAISPTKLRIWRGPKLRGDRYRMNYTAFAEGLIQIMVYNLDNRVIDSRTITVTYSEVIKDIKRELEGQVSHETRIIPKRSIPKGGN